MSLNINYCRLCLQKIKEPVHALSEDSRILTLVTNLLPGMDTSLVINSKLCNECLKCVQFSNSVIEPVRKNEQKILLNLQNFSEKSTCRLCLSNEKLEAAVCLLKNTNEEARYIIEMAIMDLDFDIFRKPVICNNCWPIVKSIYLFKKKCFAAEKILKYYCATNKINSLDRKELEMVSFSYQEKLQQFSETLNKQTFLCDKNAGTICTYLNHFSNNKEHEVFEEVPEVVKILKVESDLPKEENEIDIIEEKLCKFNENVDRTAGTLNLKSLGNIHTEITINASKILKIKNNNCHLKKSSSKQSVDIKKIIHGRNNVIKRCSKKRELKTRLSVTQDKFLFCDKCDYQTKNKSQLSRHCLRHDNNAELLNCSKCAYVTSRKRDLQNHMRNHESLPKSLLSLKREESPYEAGKDVNITTCSNSLKNLMKTRQTKPETFKCQKDNYNYECYHCGYRSKTKGNLVPHIMLMHQQNHNSFPCDKCNHQAKTKSRLASHMLVHQDNCNFPCDKCLYKAKTKGNLMRHMLIHKKKYNFQCNICNYRAKVKDGLVQHMLMHQDTYKFSCDKCNYQAKRKGSLVRHMLVHTANQIFPCDKCNYQAQKKSHLVRHMLVHRSNYKFRCDKCFYRSKTKGNLVAHMLVHQENHYFPCDKCNYRAKRKNHLAAHMLRRHTNGKKVVCKAK